MSEFATAPAQAAAILVARRLAGLPGERLPETCRPADLAAALAIQAQVSAQIGDSVGGWKCGMPADGRLVLAPIYTASIHRGSEVPLFARKGMARIEPELAFVLA
ncbi:MAG: 2-keto-4-pentenoate hydratase, partial [Burkholderiales bacterium]